MFFLLTRRAASLRSSLGLVVNIAFSSFVARKFTKHVYVLGYKESLSLLEAQDSVFFTSERANVSPTALMAASSRLSRIFAAQFSVAIFPASL